MSDLNMFDGAKRNQASQAGSLSDIQALSADERAKGSGTIIQPISADQRLVLSSGPVGLPSTLNTGLAAYWKLGEGSGTRFDSLGISNLTDNNTVTSTTGIQGNAASFIAANSESLTALSNTSLETGDIDWTISMWLSIHSKATLREAIAKAQGGANREYDFYYYDGTDQWILQVYNGASQIGSVVIPGASIALDTWANVIFYHDSVANQVGLKINNGVATTAATTGIGGTSTAVFNIGSSVNGSASFWDGSIDEVGYWKRMLTAGETSTLYNSGAGVTYS